MTALTADQAGLLQALAQIAVAFAGFAGVIGAFSRFSFDVRVTAFHVRGMVALSLFAMLTSLAPLAISGFGAAEGVVWRAASGFSVALGVVFFAFRLREVSPLLRERLLYAGRLNLLWYCLAAAMIVSLVAVVVGAVPSEYGAAVYAASVILLLVLCAYNFLMLVLSIRFDDRP